MTDLAGEQFWDQFWTQQYGRRFIGASHYNYRMRQLLTKHVREGAEVCEIGCGGSLLLPQLAKLGACAWGIDYSPLGLSMVEANLARANVTATLVQGDIRDPNALPPEKFDLMFSVGVIEHFDNPVSVLRTIARCLRPTGILMTLVPNLGGWWGSLQRRIDPDILAIHHIYTTLQLDAVHTEAGLQTLEPARYFGGFCPLTVSYTRLLRPMPNVIKAGAIRGIWAIQQIVAWALTALGAGDRALYSGALVGLYSRLPMTNRESHSTR
jgi:2-polyprenyl-3-methyl-5-hydroxy-6-metoxy-1,4-benzoquinol methylase